MKKSLKLAGIACIPLFLSGCKLTAELAKLGDVLIDGFRTKMTVTYLQPANESGLESMKRIAVIHNSNNTAGGSLLETQLSGIKIKNSPYFTFVERTAIESILKEQNFTDGDLTDDNTRVKIGKLTGADTLLSAKYSTKVQTTRHTETRTKCSSKDSCYEVSVSCKVKTATAILKPKAVSVETGEIVFAKHYSDLAKDDACDGDYDSSLPADDVLLGQAVSRITAKLKSDLAPHMVTVKINLMRSDDSEITEKAEKIFDLGLDFADKEMFEHACKQFAKAQGMYNQSLALNYNNAVCAEKDGDLELAQAFYQTATNLTEELDDIAWISDGETRLAERQKAVTKLASLEQSGRI